jgi:hypothetical protein
MFHKILVWLGLKKVEAEKKLNEVKAEVKEFADKVEAKVEAKVETAQAEVKQAIEKVEAKVEAAQVEVEKAVEKIEVKVAKVKEKVVRKPRAPKVAPPPLTPTKRGRKAKG